MLTRNLFFTQLLAIGTRAATRENVADSIAANLRGRAHRTLLSPEGQRWTVDEIFGSWGLPNWQLIEIEYVRVGGLAGGGEQKSRGRFQGTKRGS